MKSTIYLSCALAAASLSCQSEGKCAEKPVDKKDEAKPNIILILMDDLGYSDLGCYGSEFNTPNIDRLATNGIRFRTFYNSARSAPTRASLMTGLYPHQVGVGALNEVKGYENYQAYPNERNAFIPEITGQSGYLNIMTGKWHLNFTKVAPVRRGFDRVLTGTVGYYFSSDSKVTNGKYSLFYNDEKITVDDPRLPREWYSTDLWTDIGLQFVDEAVGNGQPFFWYLANNAPHFPLQAPDAAIERNRGKYTEGYDAIRNKRWERQQQMGLFGPNDKLTPRNPHPSNKAWSAMTDAERDVADHRMAIYRAVVEEVDRNVGKILAYLEEKQILDNTIIILLSDNGGNAETGFPGTFLGKHKGGPNSSVFLGTPWADVANTPYFLYKHHGHQGGCCTPFIISWPEGIDKSLWGSIDKENFGHITDIMATITEITGGTYPTEHNGYAVPPMEGVSLLPALKGKKIERGKPLIMEHEGNKMLRIGDWKIVQEYEKVPTQWRLYNLREDPTEMTNLAARYPDRVNYMVNIYSSEAKRIGVAPEIVFNVGPWYVPIDEYLKK